VNDLSPAVETDDAQTGQLKPIRRALLSIGSNQGDRLSNLQNAIDSLLDAPGIWGVAVSPVYETRPVGEIEQDDFLNAVLLVDTEMSGKTLLERCHAVEEAYGRGRVYEERRGPRRLDIDLIRLADRVLDDPAIKIPHPRAHERAFVLQPWHDIEPDAELPQRGRIADLLASVDVSGVRRRDDLELELPT
jgi:2-amino-4-hydroxy-6-hydroxymethyldihydropteridine diphosphokinase